MPTAVPQTDAGGWPLGDGAHRWVTLEGGDPSVRGHEVHAARWPGSGAGAPVMLVHGLAGSHLNWTHLAPLLAERLDTSEVWAPDLSGFGLTLPVAGGATMPAQVRLLEGFVRTVAPGRRCVVVGNSMGGVVSLLLASRWPAGMEALALIAPAGPIPAGRFPDGEVSTQLAVAATPVAGPVLTARWLHHRDPAAHVDSMLRLCSIDPATFPDPHRQARIELMEARRAMPHIADALVDATRSAMAYAIGPARARVWQAVDELHLPVLLIHGDRDRLIPLEASLALVARRPDWTLRIHPGRGHTPMLDAADAIADDLVMWRQAPQPR